MLSGNSSVSFSLTVGALILALLITGITQPLSAATQTPGEVLKNSPLTTEKDKQAVFGGCDSDPFPYLEGRHPSKRSGNSFVTPVVGGDGNQNKGLDTALACRLKKLFEALEAKGCKLTINSAMRPKQTCGAARTGCAPQGSSCHQYGKAVDVNGSAQCLQMLTDSIGRNNASSPFGLHVAYREVGPGYRHVQCVEHLRAGCSPSTPPCQGGKNITGDVNSITQNGPPSSSLANQLRNYFNPPPPLQQAPSQSPATPAPPIGTQNTTPYTPGTCSPQFYCQNNNLYYRSSTCVDQVSQVCPEGCEGTSCKGGRQGVSDLLGAALSDIGKPDATSTDKKSTTSLSAFDRINLLIDDPNAVGTTGTSAPLVLTPNIYDTTKLQVPSQGAAFQGGSGSSLIPSSQTFTSGDLMESPYVYQGGVSGFQGALSSMRAQLERALAYLRPFGRPLPEGEHVHSE